MRSRRVEERAGDILSIWEARKDITLEELRAGLAEIGLTVFFAGLHRFFVRRGMTRKKLLMPLSRTGIVAPMVLDGPISGEWFEAYVTQVLVPDLKPGDVMITDNLSDHKRASVRELIDAASTTLRLLPPYSPDFNPIEKVNRARFAGGSNS